MYELRGYVVEGYQQYIPNLVMRHAECCCEMIIVLIICDRIVYLIVYPGDHFYDHLLTQSMAFV